MFMKASREDTVSHFSALTSMLNDDLLRKFIFKLSATPEAFLSVRSFFAKSLAVTSVGGYLLGELISPNDLNVTLFYHLLN